ncbi:MAG: polyprenyl diphosphate synthase [Pseudomonadota bacterium]
MPNTRALHRRPNPSHVAIIMDGNGRWAVRRGLPRLSGHKRGVEALRDVVKACPDLGVSHLTLYAFSTENWKRSASEVEGLMRLFRWYLRKESSKLAETDVRVRFIGKRDRLSADLLGMMAQLEDLTAHNTKFHLTVAIDYGGRNEIIRAATRIAEEIAAGRIDPATLDEPGFGGYLDTGDLPDVDLVIRTSGEVRISNFLLWQAAYAEYDFPDVCWPDFTPELFAECIEAYSRRERRYGAVTTA